MKDGLRWMDGRMEWNGWDGMGWDGMGWDGRDGWGMGWDGMEWLDTWMALACMTIRIRCLTAACHSPAGGSTILCCSCGRRSYVVMEALKN